MNLKLAIQLYQNMGTQYIIYRVRHEVEKRLGLLKKKHPSKLRLTHPITLENWKASKNPFVIDAKELLHIPKNPNPLLKEKAQKILQGKIQFFSAEWLELGKNYNWITNPSNGYQYDITKHWSEIPDLSQKAGDIKYVWEKSRFNYLLTLIRYDYHFEQDLSEFVFSEIESWIDANPINQGPNWRCSQEISLRIFNWCYALYYYQNAKALTSSRWAKIQQVIYASLHHVYHHIDFSRIAVRNNHAITETLFLTLSRILFPFVPETKKWAKEGKRWFEQEIAYQIYEDGTFLQHSMNYHRVVIQLLSLGIALTETNKQSFSNIVYDKAYKSLNFLYQCLQEENGWLPNTGANDGALFFPLTDLDYRDYRPQLDALHLNLTGEHLFEDYIIHENSNWLNDISIHSPKPKLKLTLGNSAYPSGGYYLHRAKDNFTMIRCVGYRNRPNQSDNLHIDIWINGENVLRDQGSYKYNTTKEIIDYFKGTEAHNTVSIEGESQMKRGSRFMWYDWVKNVKAKFLDTKELNFWSEIEAFKQIKPGIKHQRVVKQKLNELTWEINDILTGAESLKKDIFWHINPKWENKLTIKAVDSKGEEIKPILESVWHSAYYGMKESSLRYRFTTQENQVKTIIQIKK